MKISHSTPSPKDRFGELEVTDIENLNDLAKLCIKVRKKQGQFWPPLEEQLARKSGYNERQTFKYNQFCKKLRDRLGVIEEDDTQLEE